MLAPGIGSKGGQSPVGSLLTLRALDQGVTNFVKDELCKAVILVEINRMGDGDGPLSIARSVRRVGSLNFEAQIFGALLPYKIQRIGIFMSNLALHGEIRVVWG